MHDRIRLEPAVYHSACTRVKFLSLHDYSYDNDYGYDYDYD